MQLKIRQYDIHVIKVSSLCPEHGYSTVYQEYQQGFSVQAFKFIVALHSFSNKYDYSLISLICRLQPTQLSAMHLSNIVNKKHHI